MDKYCFGVDLGGTTVKMGLFAIDGTLIDKWEIPTRTENNGSHILGDIAASIRKKMSQKGLTAGNTTGIGIGVPGPVTKESFVSRCVNLGWCDIDVSKELSELTGLPVKTANDANVAALGEQWQGAGKGCDSLVMFTLGTGVGGGIISEGRIISGACGAAGEIGHMLIVDPKDVTGSCNCGHTGCLEQAASATGLVNMAGKLLNETDMDSCLRKKCKAAGRGGRTADEAIDHGRPYRLSAKTVLDAAKAGDELAVCAAEKMMQYLGRAAAYIACVTNPDIFVIGGGVSKAGSYVTEGIQKYYREIAFNSCVDTPFALAALGNDAGITGAARMVCNLDN